jgi:hypothetical protein
MKKFAAKSRSFLLYMMRQQLIQKNTITAAWMRSWNYKRKVLTPVRDAIPTNIEYLQRFVLEAAYIDKQGPRDSMRTCKSRIYATMHLLSRGSTNTPEMRIRRLWPNSD